MQRPQCWSRAPQDFDVIVTTNMFGDILSDLASELAGSLGLGGSLNKGKTVAMAQAQHGSAPDIAGRDLANPVSLLLSVAMLFDDLGETEASGRLETEISDMLATPLAGQRIWTECLVVLPSLNSFVND